MNCFNCFCSPLDVIKSKSFLLMTLAVEWDKKNQILGAGFRHKTLILLSNMSKHRVKVVIPVSSAET